jgi:hypothetical protein
MRVKILLIALLTFWRASAQLVITSGSQLTVVGSSQLTLNNSDLVNNGSFSAGTGTTNFTGNKSNSISGNNTTQFFELDLKKTGNSSLILQQGIGITQRILFSTGFLDLNGFNADLGTTARLDSEQENSRVIGPNGGQLLFSTTLNAPSAANPANLGAIITSTQNLGNVIIKRGHQSLNGPGLINSILRYYEIIPSNNTGLNANLQIKYFNGELNGVSENAMVLYESTDTVHWADMGATSADTSSNFVQDNGLGSFNWWTLADDASILPVRFLSFDARCERNAVQINWTTSAEQNSSHYNIEKSGDGVNWSVIANLPSAHNRSIESSYSFTDNSPLQNGYYRVAEYNYDGTIQYSPIERASCNIVNTFNVWPNPAHGEVLINMTGNGESEVVVKIFDSKGALVITQRANVISGMNQFRLDIGRLSNAVYTLTVEWENGRMRKTAEIIKQ